MALILLQKNLWMAFDWFVISSRRMFPSFKFCRSIIKQRDKGRNKSIISFFVPIRAVTPSFLQYLNQLFFPDLSLINRPILKDFLDLFSRGVYVMILKVFFQTSRHSCSIRLHESPHILNVFSVFKISVDTV